MFEKFIVYAVCILVFMCLSFVCIIVFELDCVKDFILYLFDKLHIDEDIS